MKLEGKRILFISDAHLDPREPERTRRLLLLLNSFQNRVDAVFILGDLFEFWFGYQYVIFYHYVDIIFKLLELKQKGIELYYVVGNHDFSLGPVFSKFLSAKIFEAPVKVNIDGMNVHMEHGDLINRRDIGYRFFCKLVRNKLAQAAFRWVHPDIGWRVAKLLSKTSRKYISRRKRVIAEVYDEYLRNRAEEGVDVVIHGHFHEVYKEERTYGDKSLTVINPGDWLFNFSFVYYSGGRFEIRHWKSEMEMIRR